MKKSINKVTLCITGSTGIPIAFKLLKELLANHFQVHFVISKSGSVAVLQELNINLGSVPASIKESLIESIGEVNADNLFVYGIQDWYAPFASGSNVNDVTIVCPCSNDALGRIANGIGDDLITRSCDVAIKERRNLILVPTDMQLTPINLDNMRRLADIGVSIVSPVLAFYTLPNTLEDMIDYFVSRILDQANIDNRLIHRWSKND